MDEIEIIEEEDTLYEYDKKFGLKLNQLQEKRKTRQFQRQSFFLHNRQNLSPSKIGSQNKHKVIHLAQSKSENNLKHLFSKNKDIEELMEKNSRSKSIKGLVERNKQIIIRSKAAVQNK
jgi:hypothetical protein